jgi:acyl-CoA synthetase (NDP forming)
MIAISRWLHAPSPARPEQLATSFRERCQQFASDLDSLSESQRFSFLAAIGLPMVPTRTVVSADDAVRTARQVGLPAVLKGNAPDVPHKSEHGLVALGLADEKRIAAAFEDIAAKLKRASRSSAAEIVLQPQSKPGIELIVGVRNRPGFGSLLVVGLGGIFVEMMRETSHRLGPVDEHTARAMLDETRAAQLLQGLRGQGPFDIDAAASAIAALSRFGAATIGRIAALEINPLIVHLAGQGATGVDLMIELEK